MRIPRIEAVEAAEKPFTLRIVWTRGPVTEVDLTEPISRLKGLRSLREPGFFSRVQVGEDGHSVCWPEEIEMGADSLWRRAQEQAGNFIPREQFHAWRERHRLSLTKAAGVLGLSRRMVAYYESGQAPIPKLVGLACRGWEMEVEGEHAAEPEKKRATS